MHDAVVPEQSTVVHGDFLASFDHQFYNLFELTEEGLISIVTYDFPVFTFLGLTSLDLKLAKNSSQGLAS